MRSVISMRMLSMLLALTLSIAASAQTPITVPATADAYVREGASASTNFGSSSELQARKTSPSGADNRISYLKFDISNLPASLAWARVLVYAKLSGFSDFGVTVGLSSVPSTTWDENSITWNNRPALGSSVSSAAVSDTAFAWKVLIVTDHLRTLRSQGLSTASFALNNPLTSTPYVIANSRESTSNQPVLQYLTNEPPTVSITYPNDNEVFSPSPATITLTSSASDPDGNIARVEYYHGSTLIGQSTGPYYSYELNWPNVPTGIYSLTANAVDNWEVTTTSAPIVVTVNSSPSVTMTSPSNGGPFPAPAVVTLNANATDPDGSISFVEFYQVSQSNPSPALIATVTSPPYTYNQTLSTPDTYGFYARAVDNMNGHALAAAPSNVTVTGQVSSIYFIHTDHLNSPRRIYNQAGQLVWSWDNTDPFGGNVPDENPSGLGTFTCNLRFTGTYADKETGLLYNWHRTLDSGTGRYIQADPLGIVLPGVPTPPRRLNQPYAYVDNNPLSFTDPLGLCPCAGGTWDQEFGDFQFNVGAGGYFSVGNVNYTCRSNPSLKCSGKQLSLGAGTPNIGVSWSLGGVVFGAGDSTNLSGWSGSGFFDGWFVGAQGGIFQGQISLSGQGGGTAAGSPRGVSGAVFRSLNYYMNCNCPTCPPQ